jgi:chemotaxis receptor (MCP) glutamine deamidase CheD
MRIPVAAAEIGGDRGRTVRVSVEDGRVTSRAAGEAELELYSGGRLPMKVTV